MRIRGRVENGVIVLQDGVGLPEGTSVEITPVVVEQARSGTAEADPIYGLTELCVDTGISDLATNIDHYLYGHPKVGDGA